jgi:hypothetical protein
MPNLRSSAPEMPKSPAIFDFADVAAYNAAR